ncbi:hypothetical protein [Reyranella sp.]|uniref:hypothetical protein n=1 Tax=Reyranella sp. TaxID=1929291 RepID=UPI003BA96814
MRILTDRERDSVDALSRVFKAVYVMQAIQNDRLFRFGCLGGRDPNSYITAIRRLAQCGKRVDQVEESWRYAIICDLPDCDSAQITEHERSLRRVLIGARREGALYRSIGGDRFADGDIAVVRDAFTGLFGGPR